MTTDAAQNRQEPPEGGRTCPSLNELRGGAGAVLERGGAARWTDQYGISHPLRVAANRRSNELCYGCGRAIPRLAVRGVVRTYGYTICADCCELVPAAARERELAERAAIANRHEEALAQQLDGTGLRYTRQYGPDQSGARCWDFAVADPGSLELLLIDIQGGLGPAGSKATKHGSSDGAANDYRKLAEAVGLGYRAIFVTGQQVQSGEALSMIERLLAGPAARATKKDGA